MLRKQIWIMLLILVFLCGCARGAKVRRLSKLDISQQKISIPKHELTVGEEFTFLVAWRGISIGKAVATIEELTTFKGYEVYKVVVTAKTNKFLSKLFPVDDTFISYIDRDKRISRHFEAIIKEGKYRKHLVVDFDFEKYIATYRNLKDGSVKTCPINKDVQDPVSAFYFFRTMPLSLGDTIDISVNHNEKNYGVVVNIDKKAELIVPKIGKFEAFLITPYLKLDGKRMRRAKTRGYLSSDKNRLPLYVSVKVLEIPWLGVVTATLMNVDLNIENISSS